MYLCLVGAEGIGLAELFGYGNNRHHGGRVRGRGGGGRACGRNWLDSCLNRVIVALTVLLIDSAL